MKKIILLFSLIFCFGLNAQVLTEDFDDLALPTGWSNEYVTDTVDWQFTDANQNSSVAPRNGAGMAAFWSNDYTGDATRLVTPSMDLSTLPSQVLTFYYTLEDWSGDLDELRVYYKTSAAGSWMILEEYVVDTDATWTEANIVLPNASADYYIAFEATSGYGRGVTIDDVVVDDASVPNCDSSLTSALTDFPIDGTLTWSAATGVPTGYRITVGSTMGGTDIANNVDVGNTTNYTPTGLTYSDTFYVTITPYNASGDAAGCTEESFVVEDTPPTGSVCTDPIDASSLPFTDIGATTAGFGDDYDGSPGSSGCGTTSPFLTGEDIVYAHTASADGTIDVTLTNITDTYTGVFIYNDCADIGTACAAGTVNSGSTADLEIQNFAVTNGSTYYIVISTWTSPDTTGYDLSITTGATCLEVSDITIDSFTNDSAIISWTANSGESDWEVVVQADGLGTPATADDTGTDTSLNPYAANSLMGQTDYEVWVRAECVDGTDFGDWVGPVDFTTLCDPITPDYVADMSTNVPDSCWNEAGSGEVAAGPSGLGASDWRDNRAYAFGPSNAINLWQNVDREWLLSPTFDLSTGGPYQLEVNVAVTDYAGSGTTTAPGTMGSDDEVQLLISTDGGASWSNLTTWNAGNQPDVSGTEYIEDLTAYSGSVQFAIWASDGTVDDTEDYDFHVGKFNVNAIPSSTTVDFCNLQFPSGDTITEGDVFTAYGRIYQAGTTEAPGPNPLVEAWVGYSTTDATTTADFTSPGWTWVLASHTGQYDNDDEYGAEFGSGLASGSYFYVTRFRVDGGSYAYGGNDVSDGEGGNFWDGSSFVSGQLDVLPAPPTTVGTLNISGCDDSDSYSGAYDASVEGVVWVELIYDGACSEITVDTETTTISSNDTEIGLYDAFGNMIGNDDDGGTSTLSLLTETGLPAGTYYIAAGAFDMTFGVTNFGATTANATATGTLVINASTPNAPDFVSLQFPGEASVTAGNSETVYAQIYEDGNTPGAGAGTDITAEIGISAVDATTTADFTSGDWTWTAAPYFGEDGNNDEYALAIGANLEPGTYYYVSRFSVDGGPYVYGGNTAGPGEGGNFWDGSSFVSGVLTVNPAPEPTNHVDAFTATADSDSEITLTWNDNDGAQPAHGFLIVGKTAAASFYAPVDGTDPSDDTDWSDDEFEVKVDSGVETYTVTGLNASTLYDFEIYPYTNSGALIDFKTDGTVPSASATTDGDPCLSAVTTFPFEEGFESGVPPQCWTSFRGTNGTGTNYDWTTSATANSGSSAAFVRWESNGSVNEDWLVTPALDLSGLTNPELSFYVRDAFGSDYFSDLTIRISTTDTDHASFTTEATYPEFNSAIYQQLVVDLSAYNTETNVYVAFVWTNDDGDSLYLDDVKVEDNLPTTYTFNGTWSPSDPNGTATAGDDIVIESGDAIINLNTTCNSVTVNPGAGLTVVASVTLEATNGVTMESSSTSYSSLILDGSVTGTLSYERHVNINGSGSTGSNDLVSAPLIGQPFNTFASANPNLFDNGAGTLFLFGPFDKTTGEYVTYADTETATLDAGVGYRAATDDNGSLTFTGTAENGTVTNDIVNSGPDFEEWNLVGNPYPSYINVQDFLTHEVAPGVANLNLFEAGSASIYGYDGNATNGWVVYNMASTTASTVMAPGQGFFVSANTANVAPYDLEFTPAMRSTGTSDDFISGRNAQLQYLVLNISANSKAFETEFYFNANASQGFDLGYDAKVWGGTAPEFALYSHLVQDNTGLPMALQALNGSDIADVTIPLGVNANQGEQITFSIAETTLPASVKVYLEDTVANTVTLLNGSDYVITPTSDLSGTGRFFLRYTEDALSTIENSIDKLNIFALNSSDEIVVSGQLFGNTTFELYDIQGRKVLSTKLDDTVLQNRIDVANLNDGVYVVTVSSNDQNITKKVILK